MLFLVLTLCLFQSVYGISSFADLVGSGNGLTMFVSALKQQKHAKQKVQLSTWQHIVQQVVKRLQSPNQLLREAACKAGADVLKRGASPRFHLVTTIACVLHLCTLLPSLCI